MVEPWPIEATEMLLKVNRNAREKEYYRAYLSILTISCFLVHQGFKVSPKPRVLSCDYGSVDLLSVDFVVESTKW
jgi:hypothetical protein